MKKKGSTLCMKGRALVRDEQGAVLITFAIFMVIAVALYIFVSDMARHNAARTRLQNATDTVALSVASQYARQPAVSDEDMQAYFAANFPQDYLGAQNINAQVVVMDGELVVTAEGDFDSWSRYFTAPLYARSVVNLGGGVPGGGENGQSGFQNAIASLGPNQDFDYNIFLPSDDEKINLFIAAFEDRWSDPVYENVFHEHNPNDKPENNNKLWHWGGFYDLDISEDKPYGTDEQKHPYLHTDGLGFYNEDNLLDPIEGNKKIVLTFKNHDCNSIDVLLCHASDNLKQVNFNIKDLNPGGRARAAVFYDNARIDHVIEEFDANGPHSIKSPGNSNISRLVFSADRVGDSFLIGPDITTGAGSAGEIYLAG